MDKKKQMQERPVRRRVPKEKPKEKAPHIKPRKNPTVQEQPARVTPEVVYLAPKPFSRNRLVLRLATVVAVVLAVVLGLSIFFKVERIEVSGCNQYTAWQVQQASGIQEGDQLLTFSRARASSKILAAMPYVKTVRIGISLPNTVKIEIVETQVTYGLEDTEGTVWLMDSDGKIVEKAMPGSSYTVVTGVILQSPQVGQQAVAYQGGEKQTDPEGNEIPVTVTAGQHLNGVLNIAKQLERNGIIGEVESIDIRDYYDIELWYQDTFHVYLGDTNRLSEKIGILKGFVVDYTENRPYEAGWLYLINPDRVEYRSFQDSEE